MTEFMYDVYLESGNFPFFLFHMAVKKFQKSDTSC